MNVEFVKSVGHYFELTTSLFALMPYTVLYRRWVRPRALLAGIARREPTRDTGSEEQRMLKQLRLRGASQIDDPYVDQVAQLVTQRAAYA